MLRCNGCWQECSHADHHAATACSHLFCLNCVQQIIESEDSCCPICSAVVTKNNASGVAPASCLNAGANLVAP